MQIPHADKGSTCPFLNKDCSTVCHKCPLWVRIQGKNPQSEEMMDVWRCSFALLPMMMVENAQMQRQTTAAVETFRNGMISGVIGAVNAAAEGAALRMENNPRPRLGRTGERRLGNSRKAIE